MKDIKTLWVEMKYDDILGSDFIGKWEKFSKLRNIIAHNKLICNDLNNDIRAEVESLNIIINNGRTIVEEGIYSNEKSLLKSLIRDINEDFLIQDAGLDVYSDVQDVIDDLSETDAIMEFYSTLDEYESKSKSVFEYILGTLDEVSGFDINTISEKNDFLKAVLELILLYENNHKGLYSSIIDLGNKDLKDELFQTFQDHLIELREMFDEKVNQFSNTSSDNFDEDLVINIPDIYTKSVLSINLEGCIVPSFGSGDQLSLRVKRFDDVLAWGDIQIDYGDYEIDEDTGTGRASAEQFIYCQLDELNGYLNSLIEEVEKLESINDLINDFL